MKWRDLIDDKPSAEFRDRTLNAAEGELAKLRSSGVAWSDLVNEKPRADLYARIMANAEPELAKNREAVPFWRTRLSMAVGLGAMCAVLVPTFRLLWNRNRQEANELGEMPVAALNPELFLNAEILQNLDVLEDLDVLEKWNGKDV